MTIDEPQRPLHLRVADILRKFNLDRPDISALPEGATIAVNVTTHRQAADLIKRLATREPVSKSILSTKDTWWWKAVEILEGDKDKLFDTLHQARLCDLSAFLQEYLNSLPKPVSVSLSEIIQCVVGVAHSPHGMQLSKYDLGKYLDAAGVAYVD